jgi:acyl-CoA reductase-like NAD-dependent aldehyde dehydrogenase
MTADGPKASADQEGGATAAAGMDAVHVVDRARRAQQQWADVPLRERASAIRQVRTRALQRAEQLARCIAEETGKPLEEALLAEVLSIADLSDYWTTAIEDLLEPSVVDLDPLVFPGKRGRVERVPRGVLALVTPWNYPVIIAMRHLIPAVLSGNAVVWKPSEVTPRAARMAVSLFEGTLPSGLVGLLEGDGQVGAKLIGSGVDAVVFTGTASTGKRVAAQCAELLIPCSLELGGNDAAIVLADARLERTARGVVWGAFTNAGQNCAAIERVYVEQPIADRFLRRVVELAREVTQRKEVGRITTAAQRAVVERHLQEAIAAGAQVLCGGLLEEGDQPMPPTVVKVEQDDLALMREETFGPVLAVAVVQNADEAVARTNASRYGLTASIWTRRTAMGELLARKLRTGVVTINNHAFTAALPMAPWSGVGHSGHGVTNGPYSLDSYTRPFFVLVDTSRSARELWWYPYGETLRKLALAMARVRGGAGLLGRIAAFLALLVLLPKRLLDK